MVLIEGLYQCSSGRVESGKDEAIQEFIGWSNTQLWAPTPRCLWPRQGTKAHCRDPFCLGDWKPSAEWLS